MLAGGAEGREAQGREPYLVNEIKICFTFINFLLQLQRAGVTPGTSAGSSAHSQKQQLLPTSGDRQKPMGNHSQCCPTGQESCIAPSQGNPQFALETSLLNQEILFG